MFMGTELANPVEWSHQNPLPWERRLLPEVQGLERLITDLNRLYRSHVALIHDDRTSAGTRWIDARDDLRSIHILERRHESDRLVIILNGTPVPREQYRVGLPTGGPWFECLNTDSRHYGGTDVGNLGAVVAHPDPAMGEPYSARVRLPPLGAVILARIAPPPVPIHR